MKNEYKAFVCASLIPKYTNYTNGYFKPNIGMLEVILPVSEGIVGGVNK